MKILFIGGTGNISTETSKRCVELGFDLYLLNRGLRDVNIAGATSIVGDIDNIDTQNELAMHQWDVVVNWIVFTPEQLKRDIKLFTNKTKQYVFISSASCYQKPPASPFITESSPLSNPFWQYSRDKITCEEILNNEYRDNGFPICIVRPSLTFDTVIPVPFGGWTEYNVVDRMKKGKPIIVHGDGTSLFTITHATDFAKGFVGLLGHQQVIGDTFQITSDECLTWNQIHQALADAVGVEANIIHIPSDFLATIDPEAEGSLLGDKAHTVIFDNSKIKKFVPDYCATIPFAQGIKKTIAWFEEKPERQIINPDTEALIEKIIAAYNK